MDNDKKKFKFRLVIVTMVVCIAVSFSIGLLIGYLSNKSKESKDRSYHSESSLLENLLQIFSAKELRTTTRYGHFRSSLLHFKHFEQFSSVKVKRNRRITKSYTLQEAQC